jgi:3'-5' exonuclease
MISWKLRRIWKTSTATTITTTTTNLLLALLLLLIIVPQPSKSWNTNKHQFLSFTRDRRPTFNDNGVVAMTSSAPPPTRVTTDGDPPCNDINDHNDDKDYHRQNQNHGTGDRYSSDSGIIAISETLLGLLTVSEVFAVLQSEPNIVNEACEIMQNFVGTFQNADISSKDNISTTTQTTESLNDQSPSRSSSRKRSFVDNTQQANTTTDCDDDYDSAAADICLARLCRYAWEVSQIFNHLSSGDPSAITSAITGTTTTKSTSGNRNKKQTWQRLQQAAQLLQHPVPSSSAGNQQQKVVPAAASNESSSSNIPPRPSNALVISLVFGALALAREDPANENSTSDGGGSKAAASALSSTISRNKALRHTGQMLARNVLRTYLIHTSGHNYDDNTTSTSSSSYLQFNLQILNHFAKAFKLGGEKCVEPHIAARAIEYTLGIERLKKGDGETGRMTKIAPMGLSSTIVNNDDNAASDVKQRISGALALACQLQPWSVLSPLELVEAAIPYSLWHAAEETCHSAHKTTTAMASSSSSSKKKKRNFGEEEKETFSIEEQKANVALAVRCLIENAMEDRMYRRADCFATNLYDAGGKSLYVEARYYHACETISKVIQKRQIPIVDRQIDRVDKAVAKVESASDKGDSKSMTTIRNTTDLTSIANCDDVTSFSPSDEIRQFALRKIAESGDVAAAKRLASLHGIDYVYDERAIMLATAMRKRRYLQFEDVLQGSIPPLIDDPKSLRLAFQDLTSDGGPYGFDAEWDEETTGAAVLQLASMKTVVLIDMLALISTEDGAEVLKETVGQLLCGESVVAGFACRQDLSRLRASKWSQDKEHWLSAGTKAVVDVQTIVGNSDRSLFKAGLSRVCQSLLGKPLDKSEQCSMWSERPLSETQRSYAALDAWTCVAIWDKVQSQPNALETNVS